MNCGEPSEHECLECIEFRDIYSLCQQCYEDGFTSREHIEGHQMMCLNTGETAVQEIPTNEV